MKFHLTQTAANLFTGHGPGYVAVNGQRYEQGLLVLSDQVIPGWGEAGFERLESADLQGLLEFKPEIIVLATGKRIRFPHPRLTAPLMAAGTGLEVMDTAAACRTFNILIGEDRRVVAAIVADIETG